MLPSIKILAIFIFTLTLSASVSVSGQDVAPPTYAPTYAQSIERIAPMDLSSVEPRLATVLRNYYRGTFTDEDTWSAVESIRFDGTLHLPQGVLRFTAFKKKPDFCRVVIHARGGEVAMGYDGSDAWQLNTLEPAAQPSAMAPAEALNFIRDATTGGHLLYSGIPGKHIQLHGIITTQSGQRLYDLGVTLPDGQSLRSQLHMTTFAEVRQITTNHVSGEQEITTHEDFREIEGIRLPFISTLTVNGEQIHQSRIQRVQINQGVMPWMFTRPSGAEIGEGGRPRSQPSESAMEAEALLSPSSNSAPQNQLLSPVPGDIWNTDSLFNATPAETSTFPEKFNLSP